MEGERELHHHDDQRSRWRHLQPCDSLPEARHAHSCVAYGDRLFVFGGYAKGTTYLGDLWQFSFATGKWTKLRRRGGPSPRHSHTAVVYGHSMFVFGGIGQGGLPLNDLFCFNLEKSRWSKVALKEDSSCKAPPPLWGHSAVVHADCMYVFGGFGDYISNQLYRFDFESKRWSLLTTTTAEEHRKPPPRHLHVAIVQQDTMYIIAGFTGSRNLSDFFALSLRTKNTNKKEAEEAKLLEWRELPPPPFGKEGRRGHKVAILQLGDDKEAEARPLLYVHAGRVEKDAVDDLHVFDFEKEKWFVVQSRTDEEEREKPTARYFHSMVEWRSSLWVFGGLGYDSSEAERKVDLNDFYQFHPERRLLEVGWVKEVARRHESVFLVVLSFIIFLLAFFVFSLRTI